MTSSSARRLVPALLAGVLAATPAAAQTTTVLDGTNPSNGSLCPGGALTQVNAFAVSSTAADRIQGVRLQLAPANAFQLVERIEIRGGATMSTIATIAPTADLSIISFTPIDLPAGQTANFQVWLKPRIQANMPGALSGQSPGVTAVARSVVSWYSNDPRDTSASLTLDNRAPSDAVWRSLTPAASSIGLQWSGASDAVEYLLARRLGGPVSEQLSDDLSYAAGTPLGASTILYKNTTAQYTDGTVTSGKPHYYRLFSRDACGNWSAGTDIGPVIPSADATVMLEGDKRTGSLAPVVGILSPLPGVAGAPAGVGLRVLVRIANPNGDTISNPRIWVDDGAAAPTPYALVRNANYGGSDTAGGVYELSPIGSGLQLAAGRYTLRASATNGYLTSSTVYSGRVGIVVPTVNGDGNLLVRENSSQLCNDCHALEAHSSLTTSNTYGSWYVGCRQCHTPHDTTNAALVASEVQPPALNQIIPPSRVQFSKRTGFYDGDASANPADASYANTTSASAPGRRTGVCQVCHTQTRHYRGDGSDPEPHFTSNCAGCHAHSTGFKGGGCTGCHGLDGRNTFAAEAPPKDSCGNLDGSTNLGNGPNRVGAHAAHIIGSTMSNGVGCDECHVNPPVRTTHPGTVCSTADADRALMTWGAIAKGEADPWSTPVVPVFARNSQTCSSTYCHGDFPSSGRAGATVDWGGAVTCGSCHETPPLATHGTGDTVCADCHGAGYALPASGGITGTALSTHVDGKLDVGGTGCTTCHGDKNRTLAGGKPGLETTADRFMSAPPRSANVAGVPPTQAHLTHVYSSNIRKALACDDCHTPTPLTADISGTHRDGSISFGWSALARGASPTVIYNQSGDYGCAATYCHGDNWTPGGAIRGSLPIPVWTSTDGTYKACGACHKSAPTDPVHTTLTSRSPAGSSPTTCSQCHPDTVNADGTIKVTGASTDTHVNQLVEKTVTCVSCHATPPVGSTGLANVNNQNGVGNHQSHAVSGNQNTRSSAYGCTECHPDTTNVLHADGAVQMAWSTSGAVTVWSGGAAGTSNCATSYCHGGTTDQAAWGGTARTPLWNDTGDTYRGCTACHASPPPLATAHHPQNATCSDCHPAGSAQGSMADPAAATHVNGTLDKQRTGCTSCHGDLTVNNVGASGTGTDRAAAPGYNGTSSDTLGNELASFAGVGAHGKHLTGTTFKTLNGGFAAVCTDCHSPLPSAGDILHATGSGTNGARATLAFSNVARTGLAAGGTPLASDYTGSQTGAGNNVAGTCSNVYCHGGKWDTDTTGYKGAAVRPSFTGAAMNCGSCHASPPGDSNHGAVISGAKSCQSCHGGTYNCTITVEGNYTGCTVDVNQHIDGTQDVSTTCLSCHGQPPTSLATLADPDHGTTGVGAHDVHSNATSGITVGFGCATCHVNPPNGDTAHADGTIATQWSAPANSGGVIPTPAAFTTAWATNPTCTNYCHSNATPTGGGTNSTPSMTWTNTTNVNCSSCHRTVGRDRTGGLATDLSQKHGKHLEATTYAFKCDECHAETMAADSATVIGSTAVHVNGAKNWKFSSSVKTSAVNQSTGSYAGGTCTNTYCHSNGTGTASPFPAPVSAALAWTSGTSTCTSCHGGALADPIVIGSGAANGTAAHKQHVANAAVIGANYVCADCHNTVISSGNATFAASPNGYPLHVNGVRNVSIAARNGRTSSDTGPTCGSTYCHSSGQATPVYASQTWTSGANLGCNGCHGTTDNAGAPDYATGNSHPAHVTGATAAERSAKCQSCHSGFVTAAGTAISGARHTDGVRDVAILATFDANGATSNYNLSTKTCTSITCHGAGSPVWGDPTTATCSSCHTRTLAQGGDDPNWLINDDVAALINSDEWTASGHGNTAATFDEFPAGVNRCLYCHDDTVDHETAGNPFRLRGPALASGVTDPYNALSSKNGNEVCLNCHDTSSTVAYGVDPVGADTRVCQATGANPCEKKIDSWHFGADHLDARDGGKRCWDCHDPHGDGNIMMVANFPVRDSTDDHGFVATRVTIDVSFTGTTTAGNFVNTSTRNGICQVCHTTTSFWQATADATRDAHQPTTACLTCHSHHNPPNFAFKGQGDCTLCHNQTQPITVGPLAGNPTPRRNIVSEFKLAWSHKASTSTTPANRVVTKEDCAVCHMEGTLPDASLTSVHADGYVNLRDPDSGAEIKRATWQNSPAGAGSYSSDPVVVASFARYSRNLSVSLEADPAGTIVKSMMINQCLKCHDSNGAQSTLARVPGGIAGKPFGTTIAGTNYNGGNGLTACASGTNGCVTNIDASFATTNASYHPIKGKQNNSYTGNAQMQSPWNALNPNKTGGNISTNAWGYLISCWDCHSASGASATQISTPTAHGGAATVRANIWVSNATSTGNLCRVCHFPAPPGASTTGGHGTGSAISNTDSRATQYMAGACNLCHLSSLSKPARPIAAQDFHGFDAFAISTAQPTLGTSDKMWPYGTAESYKPYAFMRNVGSRGQWRATTNSWRPRTGPGLTTGSATCGGGTQCRSSSHGTYSVGGVY